MYAQFALVIAATALTQRDQRRDAEADAMRAVAAAARCRRSSATPSTAASTRVYATAGARLCPADRPHGRRAAASWRSSRSSSSASPVYGFARMPTGFLPIEDQGYLLASVQLPDGASLRAHPEGARRGHADRRARRPASSRSITIAGVSALDNNADARQCRRRLHHPKDWSEARQGAGPAAALQRPQPGDGAIEEARVLRAAAAADPGHRQCRRLHHAARAARRQLRLRASCRASTDTIVANAGDAVRPAARADARSAPARRNTRSTSTG